MEEKLLKLLKSPSNANYLRIVDLISTVKTNDFPYWLRWTRAKLDLWNILLYFPEDKFFQFRKHHALMELSSLVIIGDGLDRELPEKLFLVRNARELYIRYYSLASIDKRILKLKKLNKLNISGSNFSEFPSVLTELISLKNLTIRRNDFNLSLPPSIGNMKNLTRLDLESNLIKNLPSSFANLKNLKYLDLSDNSLDCIPKELESLSNLEYLNLSRNKIEDSDFDFEKLKSLKSLRMTHNKIKQLPKGLLESKSINRIHLRQNPISKRITFLDR